MGDALIGRQDRIADMLIKARVSGFWARRKFLFDEDMAGFEPDRTVPAGN